MKYIVKLRLVLLDLVLPDTDGILKPLLAVGVDGAGAGGPAAAGRAGTLHVGDPAIHCEDRRVTVTGRPLTPTMTEFEVLRVLLTNAGGPSETD